jgi:flavin-dependent dehydrogenase
MNQIHPSEELVLSFLKILHNTKNDDPVYGPVFHLLKKTVKLMSDHEGVVEDVLRDITRGNRRTKYVLEREVLDYLVNQVTPSRVKMVFGHDNNKEVESESDSDSDGEWEDDQYIDEYRYEINTQKPQTWFA